MDDLKIGNFSYHVSKAKQQPASKTSFHSCLEEQIKFSHHAKQRLDMRDIPLTETDLAKLNEAVAKAEQKGSKESLILLNSNLAFIVSIKNKTVITALTDADIKKNIFTNIDSTVIL